MDPATFFEYVFTERTAQLREQAEQLREELARDEAGNRAMGALNTIMDDPPHGPA